MSKIVKWLDKNEAEILGFKVKENSKGRNQNRYRLNDNQLEELRLLKKQEDRGKQLDALTENKTSANDYKEEPFFLSAYCKKTNSILSIEDFCKKYNQPFENLSSHKFLPYHYKEPSYNIVFKPQLADNVNGIDYTKVREAILKETDRVYAYKPTSHSTNVESVLKWSDLHFGSYIRNVMHVQDFDKDILLDGLLDSISVTNSHGFKKVHVHINGDLIESFSGLNHINSWMSMDKDLIGANAIKMCSKMLHTAFQKIDNLGKIKIVAGNHDRLSKDNKEDVKGGAAELICYCLELMGYDVEFHPYVISHFVDGINHINLHGDKGISKKSTEKIILDYGIQGEYNLINEGHLHSVIEKLSVKQKENFEILKDDSILHRRFYLPSFFPGNYYSATLGYTTNPGYFIVWSNKKNRPQFFNGSV